MLNFGNFNFAKQPKREGWAGKGNNAVLKNYQSALKKGKSNLHTLEEKYFKKINVLCGRGIGFILVHCGNCNFYECCRAGWVGHTILYSVHKSAV